MTEADCTKACASGRARSMCSCPRARSIQLANESSKTIASHAGEEVKLTGEMKGDTITREKIILAVKPAK